MIDINMTLIGQFYTFAIFVWFTMKFVWPPLMKAMQERETRIADGLAAGEKAEQELLAAKEQTAEQLQDAKAQAAEIIEEANKRANYLADEAREKARQEGERIIGVARSEIDQEKESAKQELRSQLARLAVAGAERILEQKVDQQSNEKLLDSLIAEI